MNANMCLCDHCKGPYELKSSTFVPIAYCSKCRSIRNKDILELIYPDTNVKIFSKVEEAEEALLECSENIENIECYIFTTKILSRLRKLSDIIRTIFVPMFITHCHIRV